jgi:RNA polymerase sigma factor (sigma-70 family)
LSSHKVNYSELVTALQQDDEAKASRMLKGLIPQLQTYLKTVMNVSDDDAEEAVHRAFLKTYEKIIRDEIRDKTYIFKYLLRASRNEYLKLCNDQNRYVSEADENPENMASPAQQISNLLDQDRQQILESCLNQLPKGSQKYIRYILDHPAATTKSLSARFKISEANVRVKKSRIINDLSYCVRKKWKD